MFQPKMAKRGFSSTPVHQEQVYWGPRLGGKATQPSQLGLHLYEKYFSGCWLAAFSAPPAPLRSDGLDSHPSIPWQSFPEGRSGRYSAERLDTSPKNHIPSSPSCSRRPT